MSGAVRIGFLGTGIMGAPMAAHLLGAGHSLTVWNRSVAKARALASEGAQVAATPREAAVDADVLILMLSSGPVCDAVLFDEPSGAAAALKPGASVIVMSSIPVDTARAQASRLKALGLGYVDAPVSGGERGAKEATLAIMAGGEPFAVEAVRPVLEALGRVTHVGPAGSGQLAKLANQLIVGVTIGAVAEAMLLVEAGGGDARAVHQALQGGFADSTIWRQHGQRILDRNFRPGAHAAVQLKDMATIVAQAAATGVGVPFAGLAKELYHDMCAAGLDQLDHSGLFVHLKSNSKLGSD